MAHSRSRALALEYDQLRKLEVGLIASAGTGG